MSLINDALKRAKQAHDQQTPPAVRGAPLPNAAAGSAPQKYSLLPVVIVGGILLLVLLAYGIFSFLRQDASPKQTIIASESRLATHTESRPVTQPRPNSAPQIEPSTPAPQPVVVTSNRNQPADLPGTPNIEPPPTPTDHLPSAPPTAPVVVMPDPTNPSNPAPTALAVLPTNEPPPPPKFPTLRLQGILYQPTRPAAIINGRTLFTGGRVGEVTVIAITRETATVAWNGQTNVLTLPE